MSIVSVKFCKLAKSTFNINILLFSLPSQNKKKFQHIVAEKAAQGAGKRNKKKNKFHKKWIWWLSEAFQIYYLQFFSRRWLEHKSYFLTSWCLMKLYWILLIEDTSSLITDWKNVWNRSENTSKIDCKHVIKDMQYSCQCTWLKLKPFLIKWTCILHVSVE